MRENTSQSKSPSQQGIQETYHVKEDGLELLPFIMNISGRSRSAAKKLLQQAKVLVNGAYETHVAKSLQKGDLVQVSKASKPKAFSHPKLKIIWEDEHYVVLEKLHGIYTVDTTGSAGDKTAMRQLSKHYKSSDPSAKLFMVNRLDRETSGFVIFAKNIKAKEQFIQRWNALVKEQTFVAVVDGLAPESEDFNTVANVFGSADAKKKEKEVLKKKGGKEPIVITVNLSLLRSDGEKSIVELRVLKGRIFSLRTVLHNKELTILGDARHQSAFEIKDRVALEQVNLVFQHPITAKEMSFKRHFPTHFFGFLKNK